MELQLWLAGVALCLSLASVGVACVCAWKPPQQRDVRELRALVEELSADLDSLHARTLTRARREQMDQARQVHETKKARQARIEEEALAIIERQRQQPLELQPDDQRAQLRARFLGGKPPTH